VRSPCDADAQHVIQYDRSNACLLQLPASLPQLSWSSPLTVRRWDAIVKVTATCICGSDLHFYNGVFPGMCKGAQSAMHMQRLPC